MRASTGAGMSWNTSVPSRARSGCRRASLVPTSGGQSNGDLEVAQEAVPEIIDPAVHRERHTSLQR